MRCPSSFHPVEKDITAYGLSPLTEKSPFEMASSPPLPFRYRVSGALLSFHVFTLVTYKLFGPPFTPIWWYKGILTFEQKNALCQAYLLETQLPSKRE